MTRRARRRLNSAVPGAPTHTSAEWVFKRRVTLLCPIAGHVLGVARQDTAGTTLTGQVRFAGPVEDVERSLLWTCASCDAAAQAVRALTRDGRPRRHRGKVSAAGLMQLLDALAAHGPARARVQLDAPSIAALTQRVLTGEQLHTVQTAEAARLARYRSAGHGTT